MTGFLLPGVPGRGVDAADVIELGVAAELLGFDSVWVGDHVQWTMPFLDPFVVLGGVASRTSQIRLGTSVALASVRHPAPLVKALLTLDQVSRGRLVVGLGVGTDRGGDFEAVGIDPSSRGRRMESAVRAIAGILAGDEEVTIDEPWSGRVRPAPGPYSQRPQLLLGGHSPAALRRIARYADGWIAAFTDPERLAIDIARLRSECSELARDPGEVRVVAVVYVMLGDTQEAAHAAAAEYFGEFYSMAVEPAARRSAIGTVDYVRERLEQYRLQGADDIIIAYPAFGECPIDELAALASDG